MSAPGSDIINKFLHAAARCRTDIQIADTMPTAELQHYRFFNWESDISFMLCSFPPIPKDPTFVIYCRLEQFNCVHLFYSDVASLSGKDSSLNI